MTTQEAIKMLNGDINYWKNKNTLIDTEHYKMAIRSLEAWEKVKEEIQEKINDLDERTIYTEMENGKWCGLRLAEKIIDQHLQEVENDSTL